MSAQAQAIAPDIKTTVVPFYFDTPDGRLFAVYHRPSDASTIRGNVLCAPPFNEELNRCRSMITQQALKFAEAGIGTLLIDLIGTGDSGGEHVDARWEKWRRNIQAGRTWLKQQPGGCCALWGIRLGVILAASCLVDDDERPAILIAWQPIIDGKQYFTQFLRMRIAANMDRTDVAKETTAEMRAVLARGDSLEISGYEIHPELAQAFDAMRLTELTPPAGTPVLWLENMVQLSETFAESTNSSNLQEVSPASRRVIESWLAKNVRVDVERFQGPAFWQLHERVLAPDAIDATAAWIKTALDSR